MITVWVIITVGCFLHCLWVRLLLAPNQSSGGGNVALYTSCSGPLFCSAPSLTECISFPESHHIRNLFSGCDYFCCALPVEVTFGSVNENSITHITMLNYLGEIELALSEMRSAAVTSAWHKYRTLVCQDEQHFHFSWHCQYVIFGTSTKQTCSLIISLLCWAFSIVWVTYLTGTTFREFILLLYWAVGILA